MNIRISRSDGSGCCDWCARVVGTYDSFDKLPDNFWGIHRGCSCVIDYRVGKTKSKIHFDTDENGKLSKVTEEINDKTYENGANNGKINLDLQFFAEKSKHAEQREKERGLSESATKDAIDNPLFKGEIVIDDLGRKSVKYIGKEATVIVNPDTDTEITAWKTSSRVRKKLEGGD